MTAAVDIARAVPIEAELARRGYQLKRKGADLSAPCPVCGGTDRFVVTPKKGVWYCRQCAKGGDVIALVQHVDKTSFTAAVETLAGERPSRERFGADALRNIIERERKRREQEEHEARENEAKTKQALLLWSEGVCVWDTPAAAYLASRRCDGMFPIDRDAVFRFHRSCPFGPGERHPCLLALLRNVETDEPQAVHRTALTPDGQKIDRKMLGPKAGAAVKLWPQSAISDRLVVGEGIETTLSAALHVRHRGQPLAPAWAMVDAGNLASLPVLAGVHRLVVLVDHDASNTGQDKAKECSSRWVSAGREVRRLTPAEPGTDFNDIVLRV
jgi:phage/plasmid primase-like uncharacterized protein